MDEERLGEIAHEYSLEREKLREALAEISPEELKRRAGDWEWLAEKGLARPGERELKKIGKAVFKYYGIPLPD